MKLLILCVLVSFVVFTVAADTNGDNPALAECAQKFAEKVQALCGQFFDIDQIQDIMQQMFDLYYKEGKTIREIMDYYNANYRNVGLDPDQVDEITSVYTNVQEILGGVDEAEKLRQKAMDVGLEFVKDDQAQVDETIKGLKTSGASEADAETAVCQQVFTMTTAQKKIMLEQKLFALVPADKLEAIKTQLRRMGKLLTDSTN
ncbi:hypothetical protein M3Y94_00602500 [Aphelenchoides besseyi]|nr:hypothetical protein M3Y94_00602500 [Aphelenchoides besseyi]KAI6222234.1 hypothetical protein M3Y95_00963200 [Aphelenchoides besseyi]